MQFQHKHRCLKQRVITSFFWKSTMPQYWMGIDWKTSRIRTTNTKFKVKIISQVVIFECIALWKHSKCNITHRCESVRFSEIKNILLSIVQITDSQQNLTKLRCSLHLHISLFLSKVLTYLSYIRLKMFEIVINIRRTPIIIIMCYVCVCVCRWMTWCLLDRA